MEVVGGSIQLKEVRFTFDQTEPYNPATEMLMYCKVNVGGMHCMETIQISILLISCMVTIMTAWPTTTKYSEL